MCWTPRCERVLVSCLQWCSRSCCAVLLQCMLLKPICASPCRASLGDNITMRDVWTKMQFLGSVQSFQHHGGQWHHFYLFFSAERHAHCIDDKVHLAVRGWPASTSHVLRFICARGCQMCFHTLRISVLLFFLFVQDSALCFLTFHLEQVFLSVCCVSGYLALFPPGCRVVGKLLRWFLGSVVNTFSICVILAECLR